MAIPEKLSFFLPFVCAPNPKIGLACKTEASQTAFLAPCSLPTLFLWLKNTIDPTGAHAFL